MIQLYGNFVRAGSFREVSEGMEIAIRSAGRLAGKTATDQGWREASPSDLWAEAWAEASGLWAKVRPESTALLCGRPDALRTLCMVPHRARWLLLAPNSFGIPKSLADYLLAEHYGRRLTGFLAPSQWACDVLRPLGLPVVYAPHGVEPSIMRLPPPDLAHQQDVTFERGVFNVAHVTSSDKQRKGTRELLDAWVEFEKEVPDALLLLYGNAAFSSEYQRLVRRSGAKNVRIALNTGSPKSTIVGLYHAVHVIVQPSTAEGFGLVPLEALACGTPVVATSCSGHADYIDGVTPGVVVVPHGPIVSSDDFDGATGYSVSSASILAALHEARDSWLELRDAARKNASTVARDWSWTRVCKQAIEEIDQKE